MLAEISSYRFAGLRWIMCRSRQVTARVRIGVYPQLCL